MNPEVENEKLNEENKKIMKKIMDIDYIDATKDGEDFINTSISEIFDCMNKARQQGIEIGEKRQREFDQKLLDIHVKAGDDAYEQGKKDGIKLVQEAECKPDKCIIAKDIAKAERERIINEIESVINQHTPYHDMPTECVSSGLLLKFLEQLCKGEGK